MTVENKPDNKPVSTPTVTIQIATVGEAFDAFHDWHKQIMLQIGQMTCMPTDGTVEVTALTTDQDGVPAHLTTKEELTGFVIGLHEALAIFEDCPFFAIEQAPTE